MINSQNYVQNVLRSEAIDFNAISERLNDVNKIRLLHAILGMVTEAGEIADMFKKHIFYGKPLDEVNAKEELGDELWYIGLAVDVLKTTMDDILEKNIEKLKRRYPEKFTEDNAINRDVVNELKVYE